MARYTQLRRRGSQIQDGAEPLPDTAPGAVVTVPGQAGIAVTMPSLPAHAGSMSLLKSSDNGVSYHLYEATLAGAAVSLDNTGAWNGATWDAPFGLPVTAFKYRAQNTRGGLLGAVVLGITVGLPGPTNPVCSPGYGGIQIELAGGSGIGDRALDKSDDAGATWYPAGDGVNPTGAFGAYGTWLDAYGPWDAGPPEWTSPLGWADTDFVYRVRAFNIYGVGISSPITKTTLGAPIPDDGFPDLTELEWTNDPDTPEIYHYTITAPDFVLPGAELACEMAYGIDADPPDVSFGDINPLDSFGIAGIPCSTTLTYGTRYHGIYGNGLWLQTDTDLPDCS